jgi:hypothetical protein
MDPQAQFCLNLDCTARGQLGLGNISVHSRKERRYRCTACGRTFASTRDTPLYRLKKSADLGHPRDHPPLPRLPDPGRRRRLWPR